MDTSQSPLNLTARLFLASVGSGSHAVWMTISSLELSKIPHFQFLFFFSQRVSPVFFSLNHRCLALLFPSPHGMLGLMVMWMLRHGKVRGKEPSQSSAAWTALYPLSTFTCFSFLNVCYFETPQIPLDFKLFWTWACHFPSLCCNHSWILQAFPITGLSYQRQEF